LRRIETTQQRREYEIIFHKQSLKKNRLLISG